MSLPQMHAPQFPAWKNKAVSTLISVTTIDTLALNNIFKLILEAGIDN